MAKKNFDIRRKSRSFFVWLWNQEGTPAMRARGLALGVFSGCFPFFGLQTFIGVILASLFKGNRLLAASGTWISNPFTYLPLYLFNFRIGSYFFGNTPEITNLVQFNSSEFWSQGWIVTSRLLLGCTIVGTLLGVIVGIFFYIALKYFKISNN